MDISGFGDELLISVAELYYQIPMKCVTKEIYNKRLEIVNLVRSFCFREFGLGQTVFLLHENKIAVGTIYKKESSTRYKVEISIPCPLGNSLLQFCTERKESQLFLTKQELIG